MLLFSSTNRLGEAGMPASINITRRSWLLASAALTAGGMLPLSPAAQAQPVGLDSLRWRGPAQPTALTRSAGDRCTLYLTPAGDTPEDEAMAWIVQAEQTLGSRIGDDPLGLARCEVERAEAIADAHDLVRVRAAIANTRGNISQSLPDAQATSNAIRNFDDAVALAERAGDDRIRARALINSARVELRTRALAPAAAKLDAAAASIGGSADVFERVALATTWVDLAEADPSHLRAAYAAVDAAREAADAADDIRMQSWAAGLAGRLYADVGRIDEALVHLRNAAVLAENAGAPEIAYRWQWRSGQLLAARGDLEPAIAAFEVARSNVDKVRLDLPEFDPQTGESLFRQTLGPIYTGLADLYLQQAERDGISDPKPRPLINARQVVEALKAAELDDYFGDACTAALLEQAVDLENAETPGAAVLYPILLADRTELVLTRPDGTITSQRSPVGADEVSALAERLRVSLTPPNIVAGEVTESDFVEPARALYRHLIAPIRQQLDGLGTIVFVPDGALRNIPLAALLDGNRFLVEDFAVGTTLGLQLLPSADIDRRQSRLLFAGIADQIPGQEEFPPLESVALEKDQISDILPPRQLLFDEAFREQAIAQEITDRTFDIVHVATHGLFGARPEDSYILAWDDALDMSEFERILIQTRFRDDPIDLLTLSACKTAEGNDRAALGIAGLAVKVGARSALASLWEAVDSSTAPLMATFYDQLIRENRSKAISLQRAQQSLLASSDEQFGFGRAVVGKTHPVFWSSFIVVGSWT